MPRKKPNKSVPPVNVLSDETLGAGFKRYVDPELFMYEKEAPFASGYAPVNDVNRTARLALESILFARKGVKAVIVLSAGETASKAALFTTSKKSLEAFTLGTLITITEQPEFGTSSMVEFEIDPLVGHDTIGEDDKQRIRKYIEKEKNRTQALEVAVVYKESITVCGHLPRYIHYDFT